MSVDRFNSAEELQFNKGAFDQGAECRIVAGMSEFADMMRNNPYGPQNSAPYNQWLDRSFRAGWADADQDLLSRADAQRKG